METWKNGRKIGKVCFGNETLINLSLCSVVRDFITSNFSSSEVSPCFSVPNVSCSLRTQVLSIDYDCLLLCLQSTRTLSTNVLCTVSTLVSWYSVSYSQPELTYVSMYNICTVHTYMYGR